MLKAARQAAWQDDGIHLGQRWWRGFKAAHAHMADWKVGGIVLPHSLDRYMKELTF